MGPSFDAVKLLLEEGSAPSGDIRDGTTPSSMALVSGAADVVTLLRKGGARDVDELSLAAASGELNEVSRLIDRGVDINQKDLAGHTPLYYAQCCRQAEVARFLIEHGAVADVEQVSQQSR